MTPAEGMASSLTITCQAVSAALLLRLQWRGGVHADFCKLPRVYEKQSEGTPPEISARSNRELRRSRLAREVRHVAVRNAEKQTVVMMTFPVFRERASSEY